MKNIILTLLSFTILSSFADAKDYKQPDITSTSGGAYCPGDEEVTLEISDL